MYIKVLFSKQVCVALLGKFFNEYDRVKLILSGFFMYKNISFRNYIMPIKQTKLPVKVEGVFINTPHRN